MRGAPVIRRVEEAVRLEMERADKAHDWHHIDRVRTMALRIADEEGGDPELIELAALVHDVGDRKMHESEAEGLIALTALLSRCSVPQDLAARVIDIAQRVSFKGAGVPDDMTTLEGKIVQDADRLDALGAIGIARTFVYGGSKGRPMYDPENAATIHTDAESYFGDKTSSTLHHFYEKLLHLQDRMHTRSGRRIAAQRHDYMEQFLKRFLLEWDGLD